MQEGPQPSAFISYSHKNKKELAELRKHLKYLEQKNQLNIWDDKSIQPGAKWRQAIETALASAKVAVLLVTAEFLASDFIAKEELPVLLKAAQEGKLTLLSIIVSPCLFDETLLAEFQTANDQPLALMSKGKREEAWTQIAKKITTALLQATETE
jgi:internalin A